MKREIKIEFEVGVVGKEEEPTPGSTYLLHLKGPDSRRFGYILFTKKDYEELGRPTTSDKLMISIEPIEGEKK